MTELQLDILFTKHLHKIAKATKAPRKEIQYYANKINRLTKQMEKEKT